MLSGGIGSRVGGDIPKQYIEVNGKRLIYHSLDVMANSNYIEKICVVAAQEWQQTLREEVQYGDKLVFTNPGDNRQLSIFNGLMKFKELYNFNPEDTVFIHDAARPYLTEEMIETYINSIDGHDGVLPVLPMKDTVYMSENGKSISSLLDRKTIFAGQAPEVFLINKYYEANIRLLPDEILKINGSTEPAIMAGMDIVIVPGEEKNIKVTTREDIKGG